MTVVHSYYSSRVLFHLQSSATDREKDQACVQRWHGAAEQQLC